MTKVVQGVIHAWYSFFRSLTRSFRIWFPCLCRYMKSKNGWCREDKEEEMQDVQSRYLIAFHGDVPVGMIHFQFLEEETMTDRDAEVAYW